MGGLTAELVCREYFGFGKPPGFQPILVTGGIIEKMWHVDCVAREAGKKWKQPFGPADLSYRIEVEGSPTFTVEINFDSAPGLRLSAMPVVNAVPALCEAPAGLLGPLDLPRYWARNASARVAQHQTT